MRVFAQGRRPPLQAVGPVRLEASSRRVLCLVLALSLGAAPWPLAQAQAQLRLPALGESAAGDFGLSQEKRVGEQIMREIRRDPDYIDDGLLTDYLASIWQPLVQSARARGDIGADTDALFPYEAFLVRDRSVNAFALPGGYVGVHLGLIAMTSTPGELASVLAHELSHITQRHIARSVTAQARNSTLGLAAMLLGLLVASRAGSADGAQAAVMGGQAAMAQGQLNFSRDMEREADRNGFGLMANAGFSPAGMAGMFDKLDQNSRLNDNGGFPYLRSHPLTVDRIGEARQRVQALGLSLQEPPAPLLHQLMQVRARVLMDPSVQALQRLQALDGPASAVPHLAADRLVALLGSALASTQLRDFVRAGRAATLAAEVAASAPAGTLDADARRALQLTLAQLALARGDLAATRQALAPLADDSQRAVRLLRAQLALSDGSALALREGSEALQTWVADHRHDATAWQLLAQLNERQGLVMRSVRAQAEVQAALGNVTGAIDRLRAGQLLARKGGTGTDFIEASVIDARLRDLQTLRRQAWEEQRQTRGGRDIPEPND